MGEFLYIAELHVLFGAAIWYLKVVLPSKVDGDALDRYHHNGPIDCCQFAAYWACAALFVIVWPLVVLYWGRTLFR